MVKSSQVKEIGPQVPPLPRGFGLPLLVPKEKRRDLETLFGFFRHIQKITAGPENQTARFYQIGRQLTSPGNSLERLAKPSSWEDRLIFHFNLLRMKYDFPPEWTTTYMKTWEQTLYTREWSHLEATLGFLEGSGEIAALLTARILGLHDELEPYIRLQGRAAEYLKMICEIERNERLSRRFLPLDNFPLVNLTRETAKRRSGAFRKFMTYHLNLQNFWQKEAERGYPAAPLQIRAVLEIHKRLQQREAEALFANPWKIYTG